MRPLVDGGLSLAENLKGRSVKVIPQKLTFPINFFETFPESSLLSTVSKKTIKTIGHHSRLRDMMGQTYPIFACTGAKVSGHFTPITTP